jgi:mevalonate kinase
VVYGYPAVVSTVPLQIRTELGEADTHLEYSPLISNIFDIFYRKYNFLPYRAYLNKITSEIPIGCGLGSSAALARAIFHGLSDFHGITISSSTMIQLIAESEKLAHGKSSGVDAVSVGTNKTLIFRKKTDELSYKVLLSNRWETCTFYLINSGTPRESTRDVVQMVSEKMVSEKKHTSKLLKNIGEVTETIIAQMERDDLDFGLLSVNEAYLEELGMVKKIERSGGFAKITGAGGISGGSGILLAYHIDKNNLENLIIKEKWEAYKCSLTREFSCKRLRLRHQAN